MRALAWFWVAVLLLAGGVVGALAWLGPPARPVAAVAARFPTRVPPSTPAPLAAAAPAPSPAHAPRVAVLVAGIGMIASDTQAAIASLPAVVSLAVSPYAPDPAAIAKEARAAGHEVILSLPMQPAGGASASAGDEALTTGQKASVTAARLAWALGRVPHVAGTTSLLGRGLDGAAFVASPALVAVTDALATRHLWFLDARQITMLDAPGGTLAQGLDNLVARARQQGSAIGAIGAPSPNSVAALEGLLPMLAKRGVRLVPVGQIMTAQKQ